jgi:DNA invertase Pin-like site-specific DNA recombinase
MTLSFRHNQTKQNKEVIMKRCVIYSRVSTSSQEVDNQIRLLKEIAERKGYELVDVISDVMSGSKGREDRKGFDKLIKGSIKKEWDSIIVWSVDRLGRSLKDLVSFLDEINSVGCDLYIHQSGLDTSTPSGKMMFQMIGVFAEFERTMISERVKLGLARTDKKLGRPTNMNTGMIESVKFMRGKGVGIKKIASDLSIGVGTVYKVLENVV